jgi:hypothetical protein
MAWRIVTYRLSGEGSRHRVGVWRELRRAGAVALQTATWAIPTGDRFDEVLDKVGTLVGRADGHMIVVDVDPTSSSIGELESLYGAEREAEWTEFVAECGKALDELASEVAKEKFTLAELDEEEHNVDRLRRWYRELRAKALVPASGAASGETRLKEVVEALEDFADQVYLARSRS